MQVPISIGNCVCAIYVCHMQSVLGAKHIWRFLLCRIVDGLMVFSSYCGLATLLHHARVTCTVLEIKYTILYLRLESLYWILVVKCKLKLIEVDSLSTLCWAGYCFSQVLQYLCYCKLCSFWEGTPWCCSRALDLWNWSYHFTVGLIWLPASF